LNNNKFRLRYVETSKKAVKWTDQLAEELHKCDKPVIKKFWKVEFTLKVLLRLSLPISSKCKHSQKYNNGVKYLLTAIDVFWKYGWMKPLKSKTG